MRKNGVILINFEKSKKLKSFKKFNLITFDLKNFGKLRFLIQKN
jgi:hypothetical protein